MTIVGDTSGTLYLLHFESGYRHAQHYLGWTAQPTADDRVAEHLRGSGSPLVAAALAAGCKVELVRVWPGTLNDERRLKRGGASTRHCPKCRTRYNERARERMRKVRCRHERAPGIDGMTVFGHYHCWKCSRYVWDEGLGPHSTAPCELTHPHQ